MKNLLALKKMVETRLRGNENRTVTIKGIKNLSVSDLDTIMLYIEMMLEQGNINGLMKPRGAVAEVFGKYNIEV